MRTAAAFVLFVLALTAALAGILAPRGYSDQDREAINLSPTREHPLGTDALGRDRWARLLYGARVSLALAPAAAFLATALAAVAGGMAALCGRWAAAGLGVAAELFLSVPWLFLLLTVRAALPLNLPAWTSVSLTFFLLALLGWAAPARVIEAGAGSILRSDFVLRARAAGSGGVRLAWTELLPAVAPLLLAQFRLAVPLFVLSEANLGVLGFGVSEPLPSLGGQLREMEALLTNPHAWWLAAPAAYLALVAGCLYALGPRESLGRTA